MKPAPVTAPDPRRGQRRDRSALADQRQPAPTTDKPKPEHHAPADKE